jgi:hypothetical protein
MLITRPPKPSWLYKIDSEVVLDPVDILQFWLNSDYNVHATRITVHISAFISSLTYCMQKVWNKLQRKVKRDL